MTEVKDLSKEHRAKQLKIIIVVFGTLVFIGAVFFCLSNYKRNITKISDLTSEHKIDLTNIDNISGEKLWVSKAEEELKKHEEETESLKAQNEKELNEIKVQQQLVKALQEHVLMLESRLAEVESTPKITRPQLSESTETSFSEPRQFQEGFRQDTLLLAKNNDDSKSWPKNPDTYVPAGSYVRAILLNGLAVSAAVTAQAEPRPVLLRIVGHGSLPNKQESRLENCRLIGAAYGDVSSERAYIRLERMSCQQSDEFTDHKVYGYISGPDGKTGILGKVIMRDGALMSRAFVGGVFGSLSNTLSRSFVDSSTSALGTVNSITGADAFKVSGAEGASNAMNLYARYNIRRAEQYQPVIEIPAGVKVDVVFNKGFYLDGLRESDPPAIARKAIHQDHELDQYLNRSE